MPLQGSKRDDEALTRLLASDLAGQFPLLMEKYSGMLRAYVMCFTNNPSDIDDIAQEIFFRVYLSLREYTSERIISLKLRPWISKIARNTALNYVTRKLKVLDEQLSVDTLEVQEHIETMEQWQLASAETELEIKEEAEELMKYFRQLPQDCQTPLLLHYASDWSYGEIARVLNEPVNTVKSRGLRGMRLLRTILDQKENS